MGRNKVDTRGTHRSAPRRTSQPHSTSSKGTLPQQSSAPRSEVTSHRPTIDIPTSLALKARDKPSIELIVAEVAAAFDLTANMLKSRSRVRFILEPRQIAMWMAHRAFGYASTKVGRYIGDHDHTTVLHACDRVDGRRRHDQALKTGLAALQSHIEAKADGQTVETASSFNQNPTPDALNNQRLAVRSDNLRPSAISDSQATTLVTANAGRNVGDGLPEQLPPHLAAEVAAIDAAIDRLDIATRQLCWPDGASAPLQHTVIAAVRKFAVSRHKRELAKPGRDKIEATGEEHKALEAMLEALQAYDRAVRQRAGPSGQRHAGSTVA